MRSPREIFEVPLTIHSTAFRREASDENSIREAHDSPPQRNSLSASQCPNVCRVMGWNFALNTPYAGEAFAGTSDSIVYRSIAIHGDLSENLIAERLIVRHQFYVLALSLVLPCLLPRATKPRAEHFGALSPATTTTARLKSGGVDSVPAAFEILFNGTM